MKREAGVIRLVARVAVALPVTAAVFLLCWSMTPGPWSWVATLPWAWAAGTWVGMPPDPDVSHLYAVPVDLTPPTLGEIAARDDHPGGSAV